MNPSARSYPFLPLIVLLVVVMLPVVLLTGPTPSEAANLITIDGLKEVAWGYHLAQDPAGDISEPNLDMTGLYAREDTANVYIGLDALASNWGMAYGIYIDSDGVPGSGGTSDPWSRAITAVDDHLPEFALYIWHDGDDTVQDAQFISWNGAGWDYQTLVSLGGEQGYGPAEDWLEYRIPRSVLGVSPGSSIFIEAFSTGNDGHAQDTVASDPNVTFPDPDWSGANTELSAFTQFPKPVTFPGDYANVAGLGNDWDPGNENTLADDSNGDGVWKFFTDAIPAGSYQFKATLGGSWDENYGFNGEPNGTNVTFTTDGGTVHFYYDSYDNYVASRPDITIPVVAGNFVAQIGGSDWSPSHLLTWMKDKDGDGVYSYTTADIPPGDWAYKVALDEAWAVSYPGSDKPFSIPEGGATVTFYYNGATHEVSEEIVPFDGELPDPSLAQVSIQHAIQDEVFYFVLPDRFANGDPANDEGAMPGGTLAETGFLVDDKSFYHGGDLAGLLTKLDYLEGMGVSAIWLTPVFENQPTQADSSTVQAIGGAYHGYWILDYENSDPHLGTNEELQAFVEAAHSRGMKVFFDVVVNHTADVIAYEGGGHSYISKSDQPYQDAFGENFDDRDYAGGDVFPQLDAATSFPYVPTFPDPGDETTKNPEWLNNPIYYHNRGDSSFTGENSLYGDFFGLDDLFTEHPDVVNGFIDLFKGWIDNYDIDGYRLDTVKHVNLELWQRLAPEVMAYAQDAGKEDFYIFGEVFDGDPAFMSRYTTEGQIPAVLDFGLHGAANGFAVYGAPTNNLEIFFESDDYFTDADSNAYGLATFISNHDIGRIGSDLRNVWPGASEAELVARAQLGYGLLYFARGFPVIYYGDEQGFIGSDGKLAREDMMPSLVPEFSANDLIGTDATTADDNFDNNHPIYLALSDFATVLQDNLALRRGAQIHRYSDSATGIYAFSRIDRDEKVEYILAFNNSTDSKTATFKTFMADTTFSAVYPAGNPTLTSNTSQEVTVTVPGLSFAIYMAGSPIPTSVAAPLATFTTPTAGEELFDRAELAIELDSDAFSEVTFAIKVGAGEYQVIGTDNNAPYRVFYDVSDLEPGTDMMIGVIVDDTFGNRSVAAIPAVVGQQVVEVEQPYAVLHYSREDGDYGDHTTGNYWDYWGLHLWGDIEESIEWTTPKPFLGEDDYGRFAWVRLAPEADEIGFIVHRGDTKDGTDVDRFFNPGSTPEIWLKNDDANTYTSQAEAQGFVTIRYHRPDGDYGDPSSDDYNNFWGLHLWGDAIDPSEGTAWTTPKKPTGFDDYGAFWDVLLQDVTAPVNFIIHRGDNKDPGPDQSMIPVDSATVWIMSGDETIYTQRGAAEDMATIHYHRPDGAYGDYTSTDYNDFWGLHTWAGADDPGWTTPRKPAEFDVFGPIFEVPLFEDASEIGYILHRGDEKDPGPDQFLNFDKWGYEVWQLSGPNPIDPEENHYVLPILGEPGPNPGNIDLQQAYWVSQDTIAWAAATESETTFTLHFAPEGGLEAGDTGISGGDFLVLTPDPAGLSEAVKAKFPHLADLPALKIGLGDLSLVPEILKGQIAVSAVNANGISVDATGLQIPGVLDDLYTYSGPLGIQWSGSTPSLYLWAPTARSVTLHLFDDADPSTASLALPMTNATMPGVWVITGDESWMDKYYLYEVEVYVHSTGQVEHNLVTDPYSISLSMNSARSQIVDLSDPAVTPEDWDTLAKPPLLAPEDITIYEIHVRDFSSWDPSVPDEIKGTYKAFTLEDTYGMKHLEALAETGLSHLHLLPVFDIATINEDKSTWQEPDPAVLAGYPPDSDLQQAAVTATEDLDAFNWGYDPWHYTTPEGSYSTDPNGARRIIEFREMIQSLNEMGLRVVMDVVYNHTNASGQDAKSVLDRIVPGYYHRLNDKGQVETSTCCQNTASEHNMMEKLMIDSLVTWAKYYKVDAFRFDLMGHHMVSNMEHIREALDELTLEEDGVDGSAIYLYGEGWNFGEVADNARGVNATQLNVGGLGIGSFSDRLRDAVRGGGPFDSGQDLIARQGFANGLYYDPNDLNSGSPAELDALLLAMDQIRVGMAGNLAGYQFVDRHGDWVTGADVDYNGQPAGYTEDPQEDITYISKHDNQTLYDNNAYKIPGYVSMEDRVRIQNVGLSTVLLGQGVPFMHAGSDMLRSKSLDRDSYNSGDWFNWLDFTYQSNNFGVGLPVAGKNQENWPIMEPLLANPSLQPAPDHITQMADLYRELLAIRASSKLFRLETAADIQERVAFHNTGPDQIPGLIVMTISDEVGSDLDQEREQLIVLFNANDEPQTFTVNGLGEAYVALHPIQMTSVDSRVRMASYDGSFFIPGRTTAVFVKYASAEERLDLLINDIWNLVGEGVLNSGQGNALTVKLQGVIDKLAVPNTRVALNRLSAFVNQVESLVDEGILTNEQGQYFTDKANSIMEQIISLS